MGRADEGAIRSGITAEVLMDRAGHAVARVALRELGSRYGRRAVVVCGKGNNGGDGYVAARALAAEGVSVRCYAPVDPSELRGAALHHFELYRSLGGTTTTDPGVLSGVDLVVDAIFGTGFRVSGRGPSPEVIEAIEAINTTEPVVSIDIPSGVDGATGAVSGPAVSADVTVAIGAEKIGTAVPPGASHAGRVQLVDIGIATEGAGTVFVLGAPIAIPRTDPDLHKRSAGSVAVLAGSDAMVGAALLTVRGAQRIGSGYVTLGTTSSVKAVANAACPEALVGAVSDESTLGPEALDSFSEVIERADALALGPGLGTGDRQRDLVHAVLRTIDGPLVLDADALNVLADDPSPLARRGRASREREWGEVVITPHPAELGRLLGMKTDEIQQDRIGAARAAAERFSVVVVLKGWRSIVATPGAGHLDVCPTGGPELATAGTGDVLTGAIAGLGGGWIGARSAVFVHGLAGTVAGKRVGPSGVVAWEVAEAMPEAWRRISEAWRRTEQEISAGSVFDWLS